MDNKDMDYRKDSIDLKFEQIKKKLNLDNGSSKEITKSKPSDLKNEQEDASKKKLSPLPIIPKENISNEMDKEIKKQDGSPAEALRTDDSKAKDKLIENKDPVSPDEKIISEQQFVVFGLAGEEFGIGINTVFEITKVKETTRVPNTQSFIKGVINLRGRIHSVIDLARKLDLPTNKIDKDSRIIIVETKVDTLGVLVDSVKEVLKVDSANIKPVPHIFGSKIDKDFIHDVIILGERLVIILDLSKIISADDEEAIKQAKSFAGN